MRTVGDDLGFRFRVGAQVLVCDVTRKAYPDPKLQPLNPKLKLKPKPQILNALHPLNTYNLNTEVNRSNPQNP